MKGGEIVSAKFYNFTESAKAKLKDYKPDMEVSISYEVDKTTNKRTVTDIGPKQAKKGGGGSGGYRTDPIIDLIKNNSIILEAALDKAERYQEFCLLNKISPTDKDAGWAWILEAMAKAGLVILENIEKKYQYKGGSL
jgi:hypothetical protein